MLHIQMMSFKVTLMRTKSSCLKWCQKSASMLKTTLSYLCLLKTLSFLKIKLRSSRELRRHSKISRKILISFNNAFNRLKKVSRRNILNLYHLMRLKIQLTGPGTHQFSLWGKRTNLLAWSMMHQPNIMALV